MAQVLAQVATFDCRRVCVTGGEPLAQKDCPQLLTALCEAGYDVSLELSGAQDIAPVDDRVSRIMDIKPPDSGEVGANIWGNLQHLDARDEIKFVLASEADYLWAKDVLQTHHLADLCPVLFLPVARAGSSRCSWPSGFCATACRCVFNGSCTSCCGARSVEGRPAS